MPKAMIRNGRSGWYYRVLMPGVVCQGDRVVLLQRPNPNFAFTRLVDLITHHNATLAEWQEMQGMQGLALDWQRRAAQVLARATGR
jgi:MOSC domain-containing protein YiiM